MFKKKPFIYVIISLLIYGCAPYSWPPQYCVESKNDEFNNTTIHTMQWNGITVTNDKRAEIYFNAQRLIRGSNIDSSVSADTLTYDQEIKDAINKIVDEVISPYQLAIQYIGSDWIFIRDKSSLILLLDKEKMELDAAYTKRDVGSGKVFEAAIYFVSLDLLKKIGNAGEVKVRLQGEDGRIDGYLTKTNIDNIRVFIADYCQ